MAKKKKATSSSFDPARFRQSEEASLTPATPIPVNPNALADLQASVAAGKEFVKEKNVEIATIALEQAVNTGNKTAAAEAAKALAAAQGGSAAVQAANAISALQAATPQPTLTAAQVARGDTIKWVGGANGSWQVIKGTNVSNPSVTPNPVVNPVVNPVISTSLDPATAALIQGLQAQIASLTANLGKQDATAAQAKIDATAAAEAAKKERAENAISVLTDRFTKYGLASLVPKIRELAIGGANENTITLQLQETNEYKQRFIGNEERIKKGLRVLDPGTYLGLEDRYRQIIRAYGLKQFDNDAYVTQFISNDISPEEVSSRVVNAVQRVQNADPAVSQMLRQYYNIGVTDMVAYVLDPTNQLPKIERQISAAEIGVAAGRQGLTAGVTVAEQLAAQGISQAEAEKGYATIADILPQATKLSQIYTGVLDQYGQAEAEQEKFNLLASAQRKRRALAEREIATFGGSSGTGRTSLSSPIGGQFQIPDVDPSAPRSVLDRQ